MKDQILNISQFQRQVAEFAKERDWEQFHTPKNLSMALSVEAGELVEIFQWLTPEQSLQVAHNEQLKERVGEELSDILTYLLRLAAIADIDLPQALHDKFVANAEKYPVEKARGNAKKYTEF